MVDWGLINEALEKTRLEVRGEILKEGAASERAQIVAWLNNIVAGEAATEQEVIAITDIADRIERGEHAQPAAPAERGRDG